MAYGAGSRPDVLPTRSSMKLTRRTVGLLLVGTGALRPGWPRRRAPVRAGQAPNRREFTVVARDFGFSPDRLEVMQDDLVKLTIRSEDVAYSLTIDEYRVAKRVPAGGSTTFEFRADRAGTFPFYSNLTSDARHSQARGQTDRPIALDRSGSQVRIPTANAPTADAAPLSCGFRLSRK